jgi:UDP-2-acetamido-2,6-beta-L-arabino-hexul-4-ose reductase
MNVLITGAAGFVGRRLLTRLSAKPEIGVRTFTRQDEAARLSELVRDVDWVFHLAGVNRPQDPAEFMTGNWGLTEQLCAAIAQKFTETGRRTGVSYTSSTQSTMDNPYGRSKKAAEDALQQLAKQMGMPSFVYRLPNVFGPGAKPNYNSAVATFCHNLAHGLPIKINDPAAPLTLVYVDEVVDHLMAAMSGGTVTRDAAGFVCVPVQYQTTVGQLARWIEDLSQGQTPLAGSDPERALVAALATTYQAYSR